MFLPLFVAVVAGGGFFAAGQVLGMIGAEPRAAARGAVPLVRVTYRDIKKPVLTIRDAMKDPDRIMLQTYFGPPDVYDSGDLEGNDIETFHKTKINPLAVVWHSYFKFLFIVNQGGKLRGWICKIYIFSLMYLLKLKRLLK